MIELKNIVIDDVLTPEEHKIIYEIIDSTPMDNTKVQTRIGHRAYLVSLTEPIREKLEKTVQDIFGDKWELNAYQFARYSDKNGYVQKLPPHYDDAFEDHKLTLDVQVKSNMSWGIVVEGKTYTLKDNQAVVFYGTDQIHWREDIKFPEDGFMDMIFCHFSLKDKKAGLISEEHKEDMKQREIDWLKIVNISREELTTEKE